MFVVTLEHPRIRSEKRFNDIANTPLWSCLMGGYAAAGPAAEGHDVCFLDTTVKGWDFARTGEEILNLSPQLLAVNAVYFWEHTDQLFNFLGRLRIAGFQGHISLFGFFPTLAYRVILGSVSAVDSVVIGECEATLTELTGRLSRGQEWKDVPGLAFTANGKIHTSPSRPPHPDPDIFPFPMRETPPDRTVSILASRGCYNHCSFCPVPSFYHDGPLWRGRSVRNVLDELTLLKDQGFRDFYFVDPNFIGPGESGRLRTLELARLVRPLGIVFGMETRPNDLDTEILENLAAAGLQSLLLGIESGSPAVLGRLSKSASRNASRRAVDLCRSVGIEPEVGFLMFVPDATLDDLGRNLEFLSENNLLDRLERTANLLSHCQIVLMGTRDYTRFKEQGRLTETGPLGFEGEIAFADERVKWMSELVVYACLRVLRDMSDPASPTYWRCAEESRVSQRLNEYLVELFMRLLKEARNSNCLPPVGELMRVIEAELRDITSIPPDREEKPTDRMVMRRSGEQGGSRCKA